MRSVRHDSARRRYELVDDELGGVLGHVDYVHDGARIVFTHTETSPAQRGRGAAWELVRHALDDAARRGREVVPVCWFVRRVIADCADEYLHLVPADERLGLDRAGTRR